ncbi:hypothetical protein C4K34_2758 [Pseudomonas chlororaphis subsp. piscium]|nr:hypothetical protein C4K34_2758 [Pseudomonas chlororaphis subsp. piscium]AZC75557.1 hypothetical protein C4K31_2654 [Pseudomonas chlororaphis subsp. piscium]AZC81839.1 hypothetical protein C4K30_2725 [Pseudomonas chlororaphis subsp. piscium]AZC89030.1 hypothetical protein C4K29_2729 [Pseudomonas chlororaphis subsp. piscium]AZC95416.1 hypothetical protein C4K28_2688 [Pseudomonas chlororaphis subsp. piscium]
MVPPFIVHPLTVGMGRRCMVNPQCLNKDIQHGKNQRIGW